jgi:DNA repair exonuclease SbcCD ATPase subunit
MHPPPNEPAPSPSIPPQSKHRLSSARDQPVRRLSNAAAIATAKAERSRSNSASSAQPPISTPQTLESLAQELDRVHRETTELTAQLDSEEEKNKIELQKLESELDDLRARRKEDDDSKAGTKAETKSLEEQKRSVDAQKSRLDRTFRSCQDDLAKLEGEASARLRDLAEKEQALADLCDQTAIAERRVKEAKSTGREGLVEVQKQITSLEESNRVLTQRIAVKKTQVESRENDEETLRSCSIDEHEDEEDRKVEREWYESKRSLKSRHDLIRSQFDEVYSPSLSFADLGQSGVSRGIGNARSCEGTTYYGPSYSTHACSR